VKLCRPGELVLFHDVEIKGHLRGESILLEVGQSLPGSSDALVLAGHRLISFEPNVNMFVKTTYYQTAYALISIPDEGMDPEENLRS
jgi:hypothetical protein